MAERTQLPDDQTLLREALEVVPRLPDFEPRAGFAASVALAARDRRRAPWAWLRWSFGGMAMAGAAALAIIAVTPGSPVVHNDDVVLAQRLELYEDMDVVQHQEALEDLDVVEVLHTLQEAKP